MSAATRKGKTLLPGHSLDYEGRAYIQRDSCAECSGLISWSSFHSTGGPGHGQCSCGARSPHLLSGSARKRWHAEHKEQIRRDAS